MGSKAKRKNIKKKKDSTQSAQRTQRKKNRESGGSRWNKFKIRKNALVVFADEDGGAEDGGPEAAFVADGGLCNVHGADDLVGNAVDLFFLVEAEIGIKFHVQSGREHFRGELFGVFAGDFFGFAEGVMLGKVAVHQFVAGKRQTDAGGDEAVRFLRGIFTNYGESDLARLDVLQTLATGNQFTVGRENRRDAHDVACGDSCIAQGELEARKSFAMFTDAFGEEDLLRDERHGAGLWFLREWTKSGKISAVEK
jgi:hypothetical protein